MQWDSLYIASIGAIGGVFIYAFKKYVDYRYEAAKKNQDEKLNILMIVLGGIEEIDHCIEHLMKGDDYGEKCREYCMLVRSQSRKLTPIVNSNELSDTIKNTTDIALSLIDTPNKELLDLWKVHSVEAKEMGRTYL